MWLPFCSLAVYCYILPLQINCCNCPSLCPFCTYAFVCSLTTTECDGYPAVCCCYACHSLHGLCRVQETTPLVERDEQITVAPYLIANLRFQTFPVILTRNQQDNLTICKTKYTPHPAKQKAERQKSNRRKTLSREGYGRYALGLEAASKPLNSEQAMQHRGKSAANQDTGVTVA